MAEPCDWRIPAHWIDSTRTTPTAHRRVPVRGPLLVDRATLTPSQPSRQPGEATRADCIKGTHTSMLRITAPEPRQPVRAPALSGSTGGAKHSAAGDGDSRPPGASPRPQAADNRPCDRHSRAHWHAGTSTTPSDHRTRAEPVNPQGWPAQQTLHGIGIPLNGASGDGRRPLPRHPGPAGYRRPGPGRAATRCGELRRAIAEHPFFSCLRARLAKPRALTS